MTPISGATATAWLQAAATIPPITWTPGDLGEEPPDEDVLSGWDADHRALAEEDRRWRQWP